MKFTRLITFPIIYLVLEPFFLFWYIKNKIKSYKAKYGIMKGLWGASAYGHRKERDRLYKSWLKGDPYDTVFQKVATKEDTE